MRTNPGMRTFPALGFDPAPGSPAALLAQARAAERAARSLAAAAVAAGRLGVPRTAEVAEVCRALPGDLHHAAAAHRALGRALSAYADDLALLQLRAGHLESRAATLRAELAEVLAAAARVRDDHRAAAAVATARIRAATDPPTPEPALPRTADDHGVTRPAVDCGMTHTARDPGMTRAAGDRGMTGRAGPSTGLGGTPGPAVSGPGGRRDDGPAR